MDDTNLSGSRVAILACDGFEEAELFEPLEALEEAGAEVDIVSLDGGTIQANRHREHGDEIDVDCTVDEVDADDYDALVIPGGLFSPDELRVDDTALAFVRGFFAQHKPVAAICHGPQVLISAGCVKGRTMTGFEAIRADLRNAGADVRDEPAVVDGRLLTSRTPDDLDAFCTELKSLIANRGMGLSGPTPGGQARSGA